MSPANMGSRPLKACWNQLHMSQSLVSPDAQHGCSLFALRHHCFHRLCVCSAVYAFEFQNGAGAALDTFMIQFNKNSFGLAPANQVIPLQTIAPGATARATVPLTQNASMLSPTAATPILQVWQCPLSNTCNPAGTLHFKLAIGIDRHTPCFLSAARIQS